MSFFFEITWLMIFILSRIREFENYFTRIFLPFLMYSPGFKLEPRTMNRDSIVKKMFWKELFGLGKEIMRNYGKCISCISLR